MHRFWSMFRWVLVAAFIIGACRVVAGYRHRDDVENRAALFLGCMPDDVDCASVGDDTYMCKNRFEWRKIVCTGNGMCRPWEPGQSIDRYRRRTLDATGVAPSWAYEMDACSDDHQGVICAGSYVRSQITTIPTGN